MNDNPSDHYATLAAQAARDAFHEGYRAGFQAALGRVMSAAQAANPLGDAVTPPQPALLPDVQTPPEASPTGTPPTRPVVIPTTASGRAAPGSIKNLVRSFVATAPGPVREADFAAKYPNVLRPSRYMAFRTLRDEGVIEKHEGGWVLTPSGARSPSAERAWEQLTQSEGGADVPA